MWDPFFGVAENFLLHKKIPAVACTTDFCGEHGSLKYT